jgi:hypothetical protein
MGLFPILAPLRLEFNPTIHGMVGMALFASGAATAVTARKAGEICPILCPTTFIAPLDAARTAQRAVPAKIPILALANALRLFMLNSSPHER